MASLKQEIEAAALRLGSRGGMLSAGEIELDSTTSSYVAPSDGYVFMRCSCSETGKVAIEVKGLNIYWQFDISGEIRPAIFAPIAKGQTAYFMNSKLGTGGSVLEKAFYPTLGSQS